MMRITLILTSLVSSLVLSACTSQANTFQTSCEGFANAEPGEFGDDPKADCKCLFATMSPNLNTTQMDTVIEIFDSVAVDRAAAQKIMRDAEDSIENAVEDAADICGLG